MGLTIYARKYDMADAVHSFANSYYSLNMHHLASDLLLKGLTPKQILDAVLMGIKAANSSGEHAYKHFMPVFSSIDNEIVQDCKLSRLGYGLVLMNADVNLSVVSTFQVNILKKCLSENF